MGDLLQRLALVFNQQSGLWSWRGGGAAPAAGDRPSRARYGLHHLAQKNHEAGAVLTGLVIGWERSATVRRRDLVEAARRSSGPIPAR